MKFTHRAWRALCHYKRNTLLLFFIFTILFSLILSGLCVRNASLETTRQMGIEIGGVLQVEARSGKESKRLLSRESAERIASQETVTEANFFTSVAACADGAMAPQFEDVEVKEQNITLRGANGAHPELLEDCRMLDGARPKPEDKGFAVIHSWMEEKFDLHPGDTLSVRSDKAGTRQTELTVIGVYYRDVGYHYGLPEEYVENTIFTDLETVALISGDPGLEGASYTVYDPSRMPELLENIEEMALPEREDLLLVALDGDYQKIALAMESIVTVAGLIFWAALFLGAVLLLALVMISLSAREFEIGVLLSMGESQGKVIGQLVLETLVPVLLGITAGVLVSRYTAALTAELLGAAKHGVEVRLGGDAVALVYLCGIGLTLLAFLVTSYKVLRFQPKKLMMSMQ